MNKLKIIGSIENILRTIRALNFMQIFTVYVRYLIGSAFVISTFTMNKFGLYGSVSAMQNKISLDELPPPALLFRVFAETKTYWSFIGIVQLTSGILLITQRFSKLGALLYFVIILNIFIITVTFGFEGTPIITGLMLMASLFLIIWDIESFFSIVINEYEYKKQNLSISDDAYWIYLGLLIVLSIIFFGVFYPSFFLLLVVPFLEGLIGFIFFRFLFGHNKFF
jgi:hypothetical protein